MKKKIKSVLLLAFLTGCATGHIVQTGRKHQPLEPEMVRVTQLAPANAEEVGVIMVDAGGGGQGALDHAVRKAKIKAGKLGANTIVINMVGKSTVFYGYWPITSTQFSVNAFYVP